MMTSASGRAATIAAAVCADALQERRQARQHRQNAHHGDVGDRKQARQPLRRHRLAADARERGDARRGDRPRRRRAAHQLEAELIARMLAGDEGDAQRPTERVHGANPATNKPAASAARDDAARSAINTAPAAIAIPCNCACAAASMVSRADRRHVEAQVLAALGRLDEHARAGPETRRRPLARKLGDAREHRVGALGRLDREHPARGDDDALPDVERRQRGDQRRAERDVGLLLRRRGAACRSGPAARAVAARPRARRRPAGPRARRSQRCRRAGHCRRRETAAPARQRASPRPSRDADRRIPAASRRRPSPPRRCGAPRTRRTACRPRRCGARHADKPRSPDRTAPTTPTRNGSRPAAAAACATSSGKPPPPQTMASGAGCARLAQASSSFPARGMQIARSPPSRRKATICCTAC